jgi:predicted nucleotidyltransferase
MPERSIDAIAELLRTHPSVEAAWVFGSVATGDANAASDLDVGILGPTSLSSEEKHRLIDRLAQTVGRPVDLIDLRATRGPIVGRILQEGTRLFCDDSTLYANLLKRWWRNQADWMPYRRRILKERRERWLKD